MTLAFNVARADVMAKQAGTPDSLVVVTITSGRAGLEPAYC